MGTVCLLGRDIAYSASPAMQSAAFAALGLDHRYELADVTESELAATVDALRTGDYMGANVTAPYKSALLDLLDEVDLVARRAGAVNTIVRTSGRLHGSNTDIAAIADEIRLLSPMPRRVVILGAGGAARAVQVALEGLGPMDIALVSRSGRVGARRWEELADLLPMADLLVNATPVGTAADQSPVDAKLLHPRLAVLDLVYRPSPTRLVIEARRAGAPARAGAGVLLGQGWRSLEQWLGEPVAESVPAAMAGALIADLGSGADV